MKLAVANAIFQWLAGGDSVPTFGASEDPVPGGGAAPACCEAVCADTPAGKKHVVICDGGTMKAIKGTADGQYLAWDHTNQTWVLSNI